MGRGKLDLLRAASAVVPVRGLAARGRWPTSRGSGYVLAPAGRRGVVHVVSGALPNTGSAQFRAKRAIYSLLQGVLTVELAECGAVVANTHLTANKDGDWSDLNRYYTFQRKQVEMLHATLQKAGVANTELMILTGDFNIAGDGPLYPLIINGGAWRDPFAASDP